ncbi:MAG: hypothetical protein EOP15_13045 [Pseudomonas sp.]|nr:MAG: hypothetical protein EOP15_13045 [Pseudomonas sp.]
MLVTDEQQQIADAVRDFAQERLKPFAEQWDKEHRFPGEAIAEMAELGLFGMLVPEQWGGSDTGYVAYAMALEEIAAGDGACSTIMSVHNSVGCVPILKFGSEQQKQQFLQPLASGAMLGAFALTEPQAGSDASSLKTRARLDGDHYVLNGSKQFITSGQNAGVVIVFAVSMAKLFASEMAEKVCSDALQTLGGYGYLSDFPLERIYRDVRVCQIYEGTSDIQRMVIARNL